MENLVRTYRARPDARTRVVADAAVVDHPRESGQCEPGVPLISVPEVPVGSVGHSRGQA